MREGGQSGFVLALCDELGARALFPRVLRRVRELLKNDAFDLLRDELGKDEFNEMCERRVRAVAGDVDVVDAAYA